MNPYGPPQASAREIQEQEAVATQGVQMAVGACILLYLSPLAVDYVSKMF